MKAAHADPDQPTLVGLDDTQQIHPIGGGATGTVSKKQGGRDDSAVFWGLLGAVVFAAAALGVAVIALTSSPDAVAGPQGPAGAQGTTGAQGIQGVAGAQGPAGPMGPAGAKGATGFTGKEGPAGPTGATGARGPAAATGATGASSTIVASTPVSGVAVLSQTDPLVGTTVTASASCPQGEFALGGGAQVSAPGTAAKDVALRSSYPTSTNGWRAMGTVTSALPLGEQMTVRPYVLCGKGSHS